MLVDVLQSLNAGMTGSPILALSATFVWGICSVILSPCHLASIPLLIAYVNDQKVNTPKLAAGLSALFAFGILITMAVIGVATTLAGRMTGDAGAVGGYLMSTVFILIGLHLMDVVSVPWMGARKENVKRRGATGALLLGLLFGVASGPCTFAFLAPVLALVFSSASTHPVFGFLLLALYALGHCTVLVAAGTATELAQHFSAWNRETKTARHIKFALGILLILAGLYFLYNTI